MNYNWYSKWVCTSLPKRSRERLSKQENGWEWVFKFAFIAKHWMQSKFQIEYYVYFLSEFTLNCLHMSHIHKQHVLLLLLLVSPLKKQKKNTTHIHTTAAWNHYTPITQQQRENHWELWVEWRIEWNWIRTVFSCVADKIICSSSHTIKWKITIETPIVNRQSRSCYYILFSLFITSVQCGIRVRIVFGFLILFSYFFFSSALSNGKNRTDFHWKTTP